MKELNTTAHKLLDSAEQFTQTKGFNAFSYRDIQNDVGVKTSSIHYYFPTKKDLGLCMAERYIQAEMVTLDSIVKKHSDGYEQLQALSNVYYQILIQNKFCLCGMLARDIMTLPDSIVNTVKEFYITIEQWIKTAIELAMTQKTFPKDLDSSTAASHYIATIEGALVLSLIHI